jgi:serine protease Do
MFRHRTFATTFVKGLTVSTACALFGFAAFMSLRMVFVRHASAPKPDVSHLKIVSHADAQPSNSATDLSNVFRSVCKSVIPSVVSIRVTEQVSAEDSLNLGKAHPAIPGLEDAPRRQRGTGSGFLISPDGYIVTNEHVVRKADKIEVTLSDDRTVRGTLIGADAPTDLAVVKIEERGLSPVTIGDPARMEQGDWVIAIGSPFGLSQTITAGIVSATGRDLSGARASRLSQYTRYLQTDASINPGNSGGPLVNLRGEVVGVNTMILSESGGSEGVGFSIPSDLVVKVCRKLMMEGRVRRGWLGVSLRPQSLTSEEAKALNLPSAYGALIQDTVGEASPAARAGIKDGDFIVRFDGKSVRSGRDLTAYVADTEVGSEVQVELIRDGAPVMLRIKIAERDERSVAAGPGAKSEKRTAAPGISVSPLTPDLVAKLKPRSATGVVVDSVTPGGPAEEVGVRKGQIIHSVNRQPVASPEDFARLTANLSPGSVIALQIEAQIQGDAWELRYVTITLE